jgi:hypothetical protein
MVKYSPNENTYKEMYLINKFEKDVMESSLQNMRHDKTKSTQKIPTSNKTSSENETEALETPNKKKPQSEKGNEIRMSNENDIETSIPEILNSSTETEKIPNDKTSSVNENTTTSEKRIDRNISRNKPILTPSDMKRILSTEKRAMRKIKQIARRAPEKRQTRKDANLINKERQRRVVTVKNAEPLTMIYPISKKRKLNNQNEFTEDIFHNWRV